MLNNNLKPAVYSMIMLVATSCSTPCDCPTSAEPVAEELQATPDYGKIPAKDQDGNFTAVVEIPAGTSHKLEYDYDSNTFPCDQKNGKDRVIKYLPYPGNYGFIPSTKMDPEQGGDGDALDVMVLCPAQATGTVMAIAPIGILQLVDEGELDDKLIAIPVDPELRTVDSLSASIRASIEGWFLNYDGPDVMVSRGWADAEKAKAEIERWVIQH